MVFNVRSRFQQLGLTQLGLTVSGILLASPIVMATSVQALPSWLQLSGDRDPVSTPATRSQTTTAQSSDSSNPTRQTPQNTDQIRFSCQVVNGQYTVMYNPQSQPGQYYPWATPTALGGGWSPERRCNEISRRLESYRPDGLLELRTGQENGYNTVCVTTEDVATCRIVLTVPPGQDPVAIRDRIFNNLLVADSGERTSAVIAYQDNGDGILTQIGEAIGINLSNLGNRRSNSPNAINLRPFLDSADRGTGARLQTSTTPAAQPETSAPRLNPGNFR
ncbi:MAG: COP23 domain-containing protein [Elainella sp. Prado103]|jgi:hypothetical protein|nr:COP23 domain-containing protein [Elainella sp. Prado103]